MSYIDESLAPNETVLYRAHFHWLHRAGAYLTMAAFAATADDMADSSALRGAA